ncbi:MAG TPA: TolC family protein [Candidatus Dormibacteraeota bacterium]|nr:TolC family protein [Candidatus Dormibacteraeota bacterium]
MRSHHRVRLLKFAFCLALACLAGCAVYHPAPLPPAPDLAATPPLTVPASEFWLPGLKPHSFPKNGLDETAVVTLAVFDNPDLKTARLQEGVASAQLLQAGLLPDPVLSADFAKSALNYGGGIGLSEDIQALISRGAAKAAARANERQVQLNILWQEWQVAERARELFIQSQSNAQLQRVLASARDFFAERYRQDQAALHREDITISIATADLTLLADAESKLRQFQLNASATCQQLDQLLGLQPGVQLQLTGPTAMQALPKAQFQAAVTALPRRRADLLALQAGYEAQQQSLREAILAQFPDLSAGVTYSRDSVEGVNSFGPNVTLSLPLFNRNRGNIAIQRATRTVLREAYQARLDQAVGSANQVWEATKIMQKQLGDLDARLAVLRQTAAAAKQGFEQANVSAALYVTVESSLLTTEAEEIKLRGSLATAQSSLNTLLGLPFGTGANTP